MRLLRLRSAIRWLRCLVALGAAVAATSPAQAQLPPSTLRFEPVIEDGFYWFRDITQDEKGFLWIATEGGLLRYDGYEVRGFGTDPNDPTALPHNFVTSVAAGRDGRLWVALGAETGGLDIASGTYRTAADNLGWSLAVDRAGALWGIHAASDDAPSGVRRWASPGRPGAGLPERMAPFGEEAGIDALPHPDPRLAVDAEGHVWIPGRELGLARAVIQASGSTEFVRWRSSQLGAETVSDVRRGGDGAMWIRTDRGFHRWTEDGGFRLVLPVEQLPEEARLIRDYHPDRRGLVWIAPASVNGVFVFDPATGAHVSLAHAADAPASLPDARVTHLFEDRSGVLWFGTTAGLYKVAPRWDAFETHVLPTSDLAVSLDADRSGRLWAGSICAPLFAFDPDAGTFTPAAERLPGLDAPDCPMRLLQHSDGTYWIGTFPLDGSSQGLVRYDLATESTRVYPHSENGDSAAPLSRRVRALLEDREGRLWIGGETGLNRYDPDTDTFVAYQHDPDDETTLAGNVVWSLAEADDGTLWVGAGGLNRLDPETGLVTRYASLRDNPTALPLASITWIHASQHESGVLWLGTYDRGLIRFAPGTDRVTRYTQSDGLPADYVKAVLEDEHGRIWAPTQEGLARVEPTTGEIRVFTEADGLHSRTFGLYDAVTLADGRFVFAHIDALVVFHPDSVGTAPREAPVALTSFRIFDDEVPAKETIRLDHEDRFFSFEFAALDFTAPERTRYAYRLDGFDPDWVESGTRRYAAYTNLPPGRYTFRARADTGGGWSERELAVPIVIAPAWWQTVAFRVLAGLGVLVGLVATVRFVSTRRLRERLRRLEVQRKLQAERERISQDLHDHVGAQLSTIISGIDLVRLAAGGDRATASADPLEQVEAQARQTMNQLRETIWAIHRESVGLGAFHERTCAYARKQARLRADAPEVYCTLNIDRQDRPSPDDYTLTPAQTLHLYRIAQEAIQNALKHAGAERIDVRLHLEGNALCLEVEDDGRFSTEDEHAPPDDLNGYGLVGMQRRADALGARFALATEDGTCVRVIVPLDAETVPPPDPGVA